MSKETRSIMPIDANAFNDPSIDLFFAHMNRCDMTQMEFSAIKLEGILDPSNIEDLDEEDLGNLFTNMRFPPPTLTVGVIVTVQGINVSSKYQKRLITLPR